MCYKATFTHFTDLQPRAYDGNSRIRRPEAMCGRWTMFTLAAVVPGCVLVMVTVGKVLACKILVKYANSKNIFTSNYFFSTPVNIHLLCQT